MVALYYFFITSNIQKVDNVFLTACKDAKLCFTFWFIMIIRECTFTFAKTKTMTTQEIADRLIEYCRKGAWEAAQKELFANNAVSIEPYATPAFEKETKGLQAIIEKGHKFESMVEKTHGLNASEPLVAGNAIAFALTMDVTMKGRPRETWNELCVYQVKDGKIISEQFFV